MATPILLFLHGVGRRPAAAWQDSLRQSLNGLGYDHLDSSQIVAPDYSRLLTAESVERSPELSRPDKRWTRTVEARGLYERGQSSLRALLRLDDRNGFDDLQRGVSTAVADVTVPIATVVPNLKQAARYRAEEHRRRAIIRTVLDSLEPQTKEVVVLAHSLGSLVAIDLLPYLPTEIIVQRLITIGSPVGIPWMHEYVERIHARFPYGQVRSWLNVVSLTDVVTARRGASISFPAATDIFISGPFHSASRYTAQPSVAHAVGESLFGSRNTAVDRAGTNAATRPNDAEYEVLFGIAFAHIVADKLSARDEDAGTRYRAALEIVQGEVARRLSVQILSQNRVIPLEVSELADGKSPSVPRAWERNIGKSLSLLVVAATTNHIQPYDVDVTKSSRDALEPASVGLGFGPHQGACVRKAVTEARECFGRSWLTWDRVLIGTAGIALLVAGPIGLALAAPAGLAGGAAITAALAAFGPGGMIGGMVFAGTLLGTGAVTTTAVLLADQPAAVIELVLVRIMALAYARELLDLDRVGQEWVFLLTVLAHLQTEQARLGALSDRSSATMRDVAHKVGALEKAIEWMTDRGLGPPAIPDGST